MLDAENQVCALSSVSPARCVQRPYSPQLPDPCRPVFSTNLPSRSPVRQPSVRYHVAPACLAAEETASRPRPDRWAWRLKNCPLATPVDPHTLAQAISTHATAPVKSDVPVVLFFGHSFCRQLFESLICRFDSYIQGGYINAVREQLKGPENLWQVREGGGTCHGYCQVRVIK